MFEASLVVSDSGPQCLWEPHLVESAGPVTGYMYSTGNSLSETDCQASRRHKFDTVQVNLSHHK